ncbi:PE domain-containing protein [Actinomycetospora atypica]|uniref:PE domain-containing protein n=1 Tax=Actinomycetospora atypica TaxID=1290095 RepID=A0ABV9YGY7_9PSEU
MSGGFGTHPDELDAAAGRLDEAARIAAEAAAALRAALAGDPLGGDEQGRAFAAQYDRKAAEGLAALEREAGALGSLGDGLRGTAREYRGADTDGAAGFGPGG